MSFKKNQSIVFEINEKEVIEFKKCTDKNEPIPIDDNEFENFIRSPEHKRGPRGQTSMRIDDNVLWRFELIKRTSKTFFNNELSNMPIIINALFDTYFKVQLKGHEPSPNEYLTKILRKLNKAFFYEGKLGEFSVPVMTYHQCYMIRVLFLFFIEEKLLTDFERKLIVFILEDIRFNSHPIERTTYDISELKEVLMRANLNFKEIIFCFGTNSYNKDLSSLMNGEINEINSDIPKNELDLPSIENKVFAQKYLENKKDAEVWLKKMIKERQQIYKESILWEHDANKFNLLKEMHMKLGSLRYI